ncbi:MAG TPA: sigma-70 family RNA polymerase sigma factor [Candidatus Limnocylindria bacterium]
MGMARGELSGDRGTHRARGEPVAALAISAAYDEHGEALRRYLARYTSELAAAEDLVQEAFVRLLAESAAGRPPVHVRAWLFRVAVNLATSRARRQGVASRRAPELARREAAPSAEEELLEREVRLDLNGRLANLSVDARTALVLAAHGYSRAEIARRIGRSELATRSMLCRSRSRLRAAAAA